MKKVMYGVVTLCGVIFLLNWGLDVYASVRGPGTYTLYVSGPRTGWIKVPLDYPPSKKICYEEAVSFQNGDDHSYQCVEEPRPF